MTIGLIVLAIVAILIFFGISERFFRALGIKNWLAFLLVLALVVGAIVPAVTIGALTVNLGGFIVPLVIITVLMVVMRSGSKVLRSLLAILAVAAVAVTTRMLIEPTNGALILAASLITGFVGGIVAYLSGQTRLVSLAGVMGGIILGDIITNILYVYAVGGYTFSLGSYGVFDSVIIGAVFAVMLYEAVEAIKRTSERRSTRSTNAPLKPSEAAEDQYFMEEFEQQKTDFSTVDIDNIGRDANTLGDGGTRLRLGETVEVEEIDGFFDDYI